MSMEMRHAAVEALSALAGSPDHRDRADAGRGLASFAEIPEARGPLLDLVRDPGDTSVTRATVEGLLRRQDTVGVTVIASALGTADPDHVDRIHTAVIDVLRVFAWDLDGAMRSCGALVQSDDEQVSRGADMLITMIAMIDVD
jgi:hypothetical protein